MEPTELHTLRDCLLFSFPVPEVQIEATFGNFMAGVIRRELSSTLEREGLLFKLPDEPSLKPLVIEVIERKVVGAVHVTNTLLALPVVESELRRLAMLDGAEIGHYDFAVNAVYTYFPKNTSASFSHHVVLIARMAAIFPPPPAAVPPPRP